MHNTVLNEKCLNLAWAQKQHNRDYAVFARSPSINGLVFGVVALVFQLSYWFHLIFICYSVFNVIFILTVFNNNYVACSAHVLFVFRCLTVFWWWRWWWFPFSRYMSAKTDATLTITQRKIHWWFPCIDPSLSGKQWNTRLPDRNVTRINCHLHLTTSLHNHVLQGGPTKVSH